MRYVRVVLVLVLVTHFACNTDKKPAEQATATDSTDVSENPMNVATYDSLNALYQHIQDSLEAEHTEHKSQYYSIITSFSGYENSVNSTWYFDQEYNLRYCEVSWDMEGSSGKYEYYLNNNRILSGEEENQYADYMEFVKVYAGTAPVYGFAKTEGASSNGPVTYLMESDFDSKDNNVKGEFSKLLERIKEYAETAVLGEEDVTIHIETIETYSGNQVAETEDHTISRKLFEYLTRE